MLNLRHYLDIRRLGGSSSGYSRHTRLCRLVHSEVQHSIVASTDVLPWLMALYIVVYT